MKRNIKIFIITSVLLNILMAGVIFGNIGKYFLNKHKISQEIVNSLPDDKRKLFKETMNSAEKATGELHEELDNARKEAANLLKAEPFDKEAYLSQVQHISELRGQVMQKMSQSVAALAEQFTQEERSILAETLSMKSSHRYRGKCQQVDNIPQGN